MNHNHFRTPSSLVHKLLGLVFSLSILGIGQAFALKPMLVSVNIDATASISESDFKTANMAIAKFLEIFYQKSQIAENASLPADQVSIAWFGDKDTYLNTAYFNCSDLRTIRTLQYVLVNANHPKADSTAIYTAMVRSIVSLAKANQSLPYNYLPVMIVITDGDDNNSPSEHRNFVESKFPPSDVITIAVAVGSGANSAALKKVFDQVIVADNFDSLALVLAALGQALQEY